MYVLLVVLSVAVVEEIRYHAYVIWTGLDPGRWGQSKGGGGLPTFQDVCPVSWRLEPKTRLKAPSPCTPSHPQSAFQHTDAPMPTGHAHSGDR